MGAKIQWLSDNIGILRVGPDFSDYNNKDEYTFACTIIRSGQVAQCLGGFSDIHTAIVTERDALRAELLSHNITKVTWERCNRNRCKKVEKSV